MTAIRTEFERTSESMASFTLWEVSETTLPPSPARRCGSAARTSRTALTTRRSNAAY
jgi:hypothetical protein